MTAAAPVLAILAARAVVRSQHSSREDIESAIAALRRSADPTDRLIAENARLSEGLK